MRNVAFTWKDPDDEVLAQGNVGRPLQASWQGQPMELKVLKLAGYPGQRFILRNPGWSYRS